jgi:hypothetical protein
MSNKSFNQIVDCIFEKELECKKSNRKISIAKIILSQNCHYDILYSPEYPLSTVFSGFTSDDKKVFDYPLEIDRKQKEDIAFVLDDLWDGFDLSTPEGRRAKAIHDLDENLNGNSFYCSSRILHYQYLDEQPSDFPSIATEYPLELVNRPIRYGEIIARWNGSKWEFS